MIKIRKNLKLLHLGEYIERFELYITDYKKEKMLCKKYSPNEKSFIDPNKFDIYSSFNKDDKILWQKGEDFINKKNIFLPASLCFSTLKESDKKNMPYIIPTSSNGCAAFINKEEAIKRAICELVERDIFLCYWHSKTSPKIIDPKTFPKNKEFQDLYKKLNTVLDQIHILYLENQFKLPVLLILATYGKEKTMIGIDGSLKDDLEKSAIDLLQSVLLQTINSKEVKEIKEIKEIDDISSYWACKKDTLSYISFLHKGETISWNSLIEKYIKYKNYNKIIKRGYEKK